MTAGRDDDALTWEGDEDPTMDVRGTPKAETSSTETPVEQHVDPAATAETPQAEPAPLPEGWNAVGKGSETVPTEATRERAPMSSAMLITIGILGGFYLLFTVGWIIGGLRLQDNAEYLVADAMFQGSFWLAVLAPALWFVTVVLLTTRSATWVRLSWLIAGAVLLVPWPFIMVGAIGR